MDDLLESPLFMITLILTIMSIAIFGILYLNSSEIEKNARRAQQCATNKGQWIQVSRDRFECINITPEEF